MRTLLLLYAVVAGQFLLLIEVGLGVFIIVDYCLSHGFPKALAAWVLAPGGSIEHLGLSYGWGAYGVQ